MVNNNNNINKGNIQPFQPMLQHVIEPARVHILESRNKKSVLTTLIDCLAATAQVEDREDLAKGIFHREELMSTGIGMGIAVPHVRLASVKDIVMCAGICRPPVTDYESLDGMPIELVFMIAAGKEQHAQHLKLLSSISSKIKDSQLREALIKAENTEAFYNILTEQNG